MRPIKTLLFFACKSGVLVVGFIFSFFLAAALGFALAADQDGVSPAGFFAGCFTGLLLTAGALLILRRKTWREVEYDTSDWVRSQTERKLHPTRTRYKRIATRILVWAPSAIAALVLFFFPVVTHMAHPGSQYLRRYRIPIPWTFAVFQGEFPEGNSWVHIIINTSAKGRFGMTPFSVPPIWNPGPISLADFGYNPNADALDLKLTDTRIKEATEVKTRESRLDDLVLTCWQYRPGPNFFPHVLPWATMSVWDIDCRTPAASRYKGFRASFQGREQDIPAFYEIVTGVRPVT
jgi:hypothetical protein